MSLAALAGSPLVQALAWTLLHFLWQGVLIAGALALALAALARAGAAARYGAACAALALMALAPAATLWLFLARPDGPALADLAGALAPPARPAPGAYGLLALSAGWLLGALAMTARLALGLAHLRGILRRHAEELPPAWQRRLADLGARLGVRRAVRLLASDRVDAPVAVGWLRPAILVPLGVLTSLPAAHLEAILAHELAHVRRLDYLVNLLQSVVEAALFYHPCVHWVSARIRALREDCCDDAALEVTGDPLRYARALAELEALRARTPDLALASTGGSLMHRIKRIIEKDTVRTPPPRGWVAPALLLAGAVGLTAAGLSACGGGVEEGRAPGAEPAGAEEEAAAAAAVEIPWLPPALERWKPAIVAAAARHGVDPDALAIVALVESRGDPAARSPMGAIGLMQIMPATAAKIARERGLEGHSDERLLEPGYNIDLGAWYLARQVEEFGAGGDPGRAVELAAAAYNGGEGRVRAYLDGKAALSEETERYKALVAGMWKERRAARGATYEAWRERVRARVAARSESPLPGARVTQAFGGGAAPERHAGIDLAAKEGAPIRAPLDGVVTSAAEEGAAGNVVVLDHGGGIETRYHHLGEIAVRPGQPIARGEVLGTVGVTGKTTGPHVHYEVRDSGEPIDPSRYLGPAAGEARPAAGSSR